MILFDFENTSTNLRPSDLFHFVERQVAWYAGKFCQYSSTDICTKNGQPGMGKANFAFCVNNGMCKGRVNDGEDPPGCICPDGFYGDHCEYLEEEKEEDNGKFDGGYDDDSELSYEFDDGDQPKKATASNTSPLKQNKVVVGLSAAVIVVVIVFVGFIARALFKSPPGSTAADIKGALSEEETSATPSNISGIIHSSSGDGSLEDIEVDDYVNNHSNVLTDKEMTNVQIV